MALARLALRVALALDLVEPLLDRLDAHIDHAAVELDLGLARTTAQTDAATLTLQVRPAPHQSGREITQPRQLDLQLAFVAARPRRKDLEDQGGAVEHLDAQMALQIALLRRPERLIKDHTVSLIQIDQGLDLVGLARADEQGRIRRLAPCHQTGHTRVASRLGQQREFVQTGIKGSP